MKYSTTLPLIIALLPTWSVALTVNTTSDSASASSTNGLATCKAIAASVSSASQVFYPGSTGYASDVEHWLKSSSEKSICSVEPGSSNDVAKILQILAKTSDKFAIKSGGHATDIGISSTSGIQIAMSRFNSTTVNKKDSTVTVGLGQKWERVYGALNGTGLGVLGGRLYGVGVGGYLLGGGYSWLSNKHGLAIDTIVGYELVLPSGKVVKVSATSYPDLFAGLKGGYNNFGIVISATLKAVPVGNVYAGIISYTDEKVFDRVWNAVLDFQNTNKDLDGNIITFYTVSPDGSKGINIGVFYNGQAPKNMFKSFLDIPYSSNAAKQQLMIDYVMWTKNVSPANELVRGQYGSVSLPTLNMEMIKTAVNQTNYYGTGGPGSFGNGTTFQTVIEPFSSAAIVAKSASVSAFPHNTFNLPFNSVAMWPDASQDEAGRKAIAATNAAMQAFITGKGMDAAIPRYPNYAAVTESMTQLYGSNMDWLRPLRAKYDPKGTMLRAAGRKFV